MTIMRFDNYDEASEVAHEFSVYDGVDYKVEGNTETGFIVETDDSFKGT